MSTTQNREDAIPSNHIFNQIIQDAHVIQNWKYFARNLGVSDDDIVDIDYKERSLKEKCYQMLSLWRTNKGYAATTRALMDTLRCCGYNNIADQFEADTHLDSSQVHDREGSSSNQLAADIKDLEEEFSNKGDVYIGRAKQIDQVISSWKSVSIFGVYGLAGIGKSRFVRHVTRRLKEEFESTHKRSKFQLHIIDLRGVHSSDDLKIKFSTSVGMKPSSLSYVQQMKEEMSASRDLYVFVFENVECIEDIKPIRSEFLNDCRSLATDNPRVRIFINSRVKHAILEPTFLPVELKSLKLKESEDLLKNTAPNVDFGEHLEKIIDMCGGHPMALKIVAKRIQYEEFLTVEEIVADLQHDRLAALDGEEYSDEERIALMINRTLCHLNDEQKLNLFQLSYMKNSFSMHAVAEILDLGDTAAAKKTILQDLYRRHLVDVEQMKGGIIRVSIHALVREWVAKNIKFTHVEDLRLRYVKHYGKLFRDFGSKLKSKDGAVPAMADFGLELSNLKKLISESKNCDEQMFTEIYREIIYKDSYIIEKYMTDQAVSFFENIYDRVGTFVSAVDRGVIMTNLASALSDISDEPKQAMTWFDRAEKDLSEGGASMELAVVLRKKAWNFSLLDLLDDSITYALKARDMFQELGKQKEIPYMVTIAILGIVNTQKGNLDEGEKYNLQSINLCKEIVGRQYSLGGYYNNLGITYMQKGDLEKAQSYIQESLDIKKDFVFGPDRSVSMSLISLAVIHLDLHGNPDKAKQLLSEAKNQLERLPFSALLHGNVHYDLCKVHLRTGDYSSALQAALAAINIYRQHKKEARSIMWIESLTQYGEVLYKLHRYDESLAALQEAYDLRHVVYEQMPKRLLLHDTLVLLIRTTVALGRRDEALAFYQEACKKLKEVHDLYEAENNTKGKEKTMSDLLSFQKEFGSQL